MVKSLSMNRYWCGVIGIFLVCLFVLLWGAIDNLGNNVNQLTEKFNQFDVKFSSKMEKMSKDIDDLILLLP